MRVARMNHAISVVEDEPTITITAKLVSKIDNIKQKCLFQNPITVTINVIYNIFKDVLQLRYNLFFGKNKVCFFKAIVSFF